MDERHSLDVEYVRSSLALLQEYDTTLRIFASSEHRYCLRPIATEKEVSKFEKARSIRLPEDYRRFLLEIGNGGAGPYYGIHGLDDFEEPSIDGYDDPSLPFPYNDTWNGRPGELAAIEAAESNIELHCELVDNYWQYAARNGSLSICDFGCNLRFLLVVNGDEYGNIWFDEVADMRGYSPVRFDLMDRSAKYDRWQSPDKAANKVRRLTFAQWYNAWLDWALRVVKD